LAGNAVACKLRDVDEQPQNPTPGPERRESKSGLDQFAKYSELALVLPGGCFGGWIVGAFLDSRFHTHWIYLLGLVLGFVGGFVHIIRVALRDSK
jgi:F0F1-type ATP synthase assembly protein I